MTKGKRLRQILSFFVSFALVLSCVFAYAPTINAAGELATITGEGVKVRTAPNTKNSTVLTKVSLCTVTVNSVVEGEEAESGGGTRWYNITYNNYTGYVYGKYVKVLEPPPESPYDEDFEKNILNFPESYREQIRKLHNMYPNWTFEVHNLGISFDEALAKEDVFPKKLVPQSYSNSLKSMGKNAYDWSNGDFKTDAGQWVGASTEVIAYHMDPRNFLNFEDIYMFARLTYDADSETADGIKKIVSGTFLDTADYIDIFLRVARETGVSAYMIASTLRQEQSANSPLISGTYPGYEGYYNFFNVKASGVSENDVTINGLKHAKEKGWTSPYLSIKGGAELLASKYFEYGQNTYYYKNFDVISGNCSFQYAQNIYDSKSSGANLRKVYIGNQESVLHFIIPVYKDMWSSPAPAAPENDGLNNYYFTSLGVPNFSMYTENYSLSISGDTTIGYKVPAGASYTGSSSYTLNAGSNTVKLTVKAQSGSNNVYTLNITASKACTLKIDGSSAAVAVKKGDTNGDGNITIVDLARVQKHLLKVSILSGNDLAGADTNGDGNVTIVDLARIQKHLLKLITIS